MTLLQSHTRMLVTYALLFGKLAGLLVNDTVLLVTYAISLVTYITLLVIRVILFGKHIRILVSCILFPVRHIHSSESNMVLLLIHKDCSVKDECSFVNDKLLQVSDILPF